MSVSSQRGPLIVIVLFLVVAAAVMLMRSDARPGGDLRTVTPGKADTERDVVADEVKERIERQPTGVTVTDQATGTTKAGVQWSFRRETDRAAAYTDLYGNVVRGATGPAGPPAASLKLTFPQDVTRARIQAALRELLSDRSLTVTDGPQKRMTVIRSERVVAAPLQITGRKAFINGIFDRGLCARQKKEFPAATDLKVSCAGGEPEIRFDPRKARG